MTTIEMSVAVEMLNLIKNFHYLSDDPDLEMANFIARDIAQVVQTWLVTENVQYPKALGYFLVDGDKTPFIPSHTLIGIQNYIEKRCLPGSFLHAVFSNNLREAYRCADHLNRPALEEIVRYLYNYAPIQCWGSEEKVHAWLNEPTQEEDEQQ